MDPMNSEGNKFQELSSQGALAAGLPQGVKVRVGHAVDRIDIDQNELRTQMSGL